jgi:hypothetical protein
VHAVFPPAVAHQQNTLLFAGQELCLAPAKDSAGDAHSLLVRPVSHGGGKLDESVSEFASRMIVILVIGSVQSSRTQLARSDDVIGDWCQG